MGSFNTSCFVSRQTVAPGDPCKLVPIRQQRTYKPLEATLDDQVESVWGHCHMKCYPHRFWEPVGGFFDAVYDDYGSFVLTDNVNNRALLPEFLRSALRYVPKVAQGQNSSHDLACDLRAFMVEEAPELLKHLVPDKHQKESVTPAAEVLWEQSLDSWQYLWERAQQARLLWADHFGILRPTSFAVIHGDAFDELVRMTSERRSYSDESYAMRAFFDRALASMQNWLDEKKAKAAASGSEHEPKVDTFFASERLYNALSRMGGNLDYRPMDAADALYDYCVAYLEQKTMTADELYAALEPLIQVRYACAGLQSLNLHFEPIVYAGQDYDNEVGLAYQAFVEKVSVKVARGRKVHHYGEFRNYVLTVKDAGVFDLLTKQAREWDAALNLQKTEPHPVLGSTTLAFFECTAELEDLAEMLKDFCTETGNQALAADTLRTLDAAKDHVPE